MLPTPLVKLLSLRKLGLGARTFILEGLGARRLILEGLVRARLNPLLLTLDLLLLLAAKISHHLDTRYHPPFVNPSWVFLTEKQSDYGKKEGKNSIRPSFEVCRFYLWRVIPSLEVPRWLRWGDGRGDVSTFPTSNVVVLISS